MLWRAFMDGDPQPLAHLPIDEQMIVTVASNAHNKGRCPKIQDFRNRRLHLKHRYAGSLLRSTACSDLRQCAKSWRGPAPFSSDARFVNGSFACTPIHWRLPTF